MLLAGPIVWLGLRSLRAMEKVRRWTAISLRLILLLLLTLMLADLQMVSFHSDLTLVVAMDQSESVRKFADLKALGEAAEARDPSSKADYKSTEDWIADVTSDFAEDKREDDKVAVLSFDGRTMVRSQPSKIVNSDPGVIVSPAEGTNTSKAIRSSIGMFDAASNARVMLITDGNDTEGDMIDAAYEAAAAGIPIDVLITPLRNQNEVMVEKLIAPVEAREGQTVALRVVLRANVPATGFLHIKHNEQFIDLKIVDDNRGRPVNNDEWSLRKHEGDEGATPLGRYEAVIDDIELPLNFTGVNNFQAVFMPDDGYDATPINNVADACTVVKGRGTILFVDGLENSSGDILPQTLANHDLRIKKISPAAFPATLRQLQQYDAIVFQDVSADKISQRSQTNIVKYVRDLGGGFIMLGGQGAFGAGGWTNSPIDKKILPVSCQIPSQTLLPSGALVLVIDRSGSMTGMVNGTYRNKQQLANESAVLALSTLYPQDLVGVVAFDQSPYLISDVKPNNKPDAVAERIRAIEPGGGTNIYSGLQLAYRKLAPLRTSDAAIKHIILLTDGQSETDQAAYNKLFRKMAVAGITLSSIGVGDDVDHTFMQWVAQRCGGQYTPVSDPTMLPQVFIKEAKTIRKNLVKEIDFTPQQRMTGSPIINKFSAYPALRGYVLTGERNDRPVYTPLVGPEQEPIFAHGRVGLGRVAAFTSDATNRWAVNWLRWGGYADFWTRIVRAVARPAQSSEIDIFSEIRGNQMVVRIDAGLGFEKSRHGKAQFDNSLRATGAIMSPDGEIIDTEFTQTGPGMYEAVVPVSGAGNYVVEAMMTDIAGRQERATSGATRLPGKELRRFDTNMTALKRVTDITGGQLINPLAASNFNPFKRDQEIYASTLRSVWMPLLYLLLILLILDVANRRIAWDAAEIVQWYRHRRAERKRRKSRKTEQTLSSLRRTKDETTEATRTDEDALAEAAVAVAAIEEQQRQKLIQAARDRRAGKKFAATESKGKVAKPLAESLGGAANAPTHKPAPIITKKPNDKQDEDVTSRLLSAKRRANRRLDQD